MLQTIRQKQSLSILALSITLGFQSVTLPAFADAGSVPQITSQTLPSGQQVVVQETHAEPIVSIQTCVNTGSAQEVEKDNGVSHFLEHLLFKGTQSHPTGTIDRMLDEKGVTFNAFTSDDTTCYTLTTASPYVKTVLPLHADMLLNANFPLPELDRERKVVQEEINRAMDNPQRKLYIAMSKLLYGTHPYSMDTLGPKGNIASLPREAILAYYHKWYQPRNFKTVVVGDVNTQEVIQQVDDAFKAAYVQQVRPQPGQPKLSGVVPVAKPQSMVMDDPNLSVSHLTLGFLAPPITNRKDNYALDIAAMILGQGESSRLYQALKAGRVTL